MSDISSDTPFREAKFTQVIQRASYAELVELALIESERLNLSYLDDDGVTKKYSKDNFKEESFSHDFLISWVINFGCLTTDKQREDYLSIMALNNEEPNYENVISDRQAVEKILLEHNNNPQN